MIEQCEEVVSCIYNNRSVILWHGIYQGFVPPKSMCTITCQTLINVTGVCVSITCMHRPCYIAPSANSCVLARQTIRVEYTLSLNVTRFAKAEFQFIV